MSRTTRFHDDRLWREGYDEASSPHSAFCRVLDYGTSGVKSKYPRAQNTNSQNEEQNKIPVVAGQSITRTFVPRKVQAIVVGDLFLQRDGQIPDRKEARKLSQHTRKKDLKS